MTAPSRSASEPSRSASGPSRPETAPWLLHEHAIVRSTGFPADLVDTLAHCRTIERLVDLERAEALLAEAVSRVVDAARRHPDALTPREQRRVRRALHRHAELPPDLPDPLPAPMAAAFHGYRCALADVEAARREAEATLVEETAEVHRGMVKLAEDEHLREAVWLSSPTMLTRGLTELAACAERPGSGAARRLRRQLAGYLQRLAVKNETTSFFGPINYADFGDGPGAEPVTGPPVVRRAALAHWAVLRIADAIAAEPAMRPHLRPRRSGLLTDPAGPEPTLAGRALRLDAAVLRLLRAVDGERTVAELAGVLGVTVDQAVALVDLAARGRSLVVDCRPPISDIDPLGWLARWLRTLPPSVADRWTTVVARMRELLAEFETAALDRRMVLLAEVEAELASLADGPVRRGGGQWYADRLAVHEECLGSFGPLHLGSQAHRSLTRRLAPAMTVLAAEAVARHRALTEAFVARHPQLAQGHVVGLLELLRSETQAEPPVVPLVMSPAGRAVEAAVAAADPAEPLRIDPGLLPPVDLGDDPLIASPDLMFPTDRFGDVLAGTAPIVLAECHDTLLVWGWAVQFHPDRPAVRAAGAELLDRARGERRLATVPGSRRAKIVPFDYPGPVIDLGQAPLPVGSRGVPLAEVGVRLRGGRLVCTTAGLPDFLLYHGELDSTVHNVLAPPRVRPVRFGGGERTPRIMLGDVVIQRARWDLPRARLFPDGGQPPGQLAALRHARACAEATGLPRRTFLKVPGERKPVLLDLFAPALLDLGWHLANRPAGGGPAADVVTLTELLPTSRQLWLRGPRGRHCAELRTTLVLDRTGPLTDGGDHR